MAKTAMRQKEFGSDLGLVHEVVVRGRRVGAGESFWKALHDNETLFRRVVRLVEGNEVPSGYVTPEEGAQIMGDNFHHVADAESHFGFRLSANQRRSFLNVPFAHEVLQAHKSTHVLAPIMPMSLAQIHETVSGEFWPGQQQNPWFGDSNQEFAHAKARTGWQLIRKDEVPGSTSTSWSEQLQLLGEDEFVPKVSVASQAAILHYLETEERMFSRVWVRTDDVAARGSRVDVHFYADGFLVAHWGDGAVRDLGVASARKSN